MKRNAADGLFTKPSMFEFRSHKATFLFPGQVHFLFDREIFVA